MVLAAVPQVMGIQRQRDHQRLWCLFFRQYEDASFTRVVENLFSCYDHILGGTSQPLLDTIFILGGSVCGLFQNPMGESECGCQSGRCLD